MNYLPPVLKYLRNFLDTDQPNVMLNREQAYWTIKYYTDSVETIGELENLLKIGIEDDI